MSLSDAVMGIIFDATQTKVVLIKRADIPIWVLPGGGIDVGETPEEAVVREVQEETGLQVEIIRKTAEYRPLNALAALTHVYECRKIEGDLLCGSETSQIGLFPLLQLPSPFFPLHAEWIHDSLNSTETLYKTISQLTFPRIFKFFLAHPWIVLKYLASRFLTIRGSHGQ